MFFHDKVRQRSICHIGGESTNTVVQETGTQKLQADMLRQLSPDVLQYLQGQLRGMNQVNPQLVAMLNQATGKGITPGMQQAITGIQQQMRQAGAKAGIAPGDPRMSTAINNMGEVGTKANLPEVQTILSMFGANPQGTMAQMGGGGPAGTTSTTPADTMGQIGSGVSTALMLAMLAKSAGLFGAGAGAATAASAASASDERLKNLYQMSDKGLEAIERIKPITFAYKDNPDIILDGLSAQNVQEAIPEAVAPMHNDFLAVLVFPVISALINAVNELSVEVKALKQQSME